MSTLNATLCLQVEGMSCGKCEAKLSQVLAGLPGVRDVLASASTGQVQVVHSKRQKPSFESLSNAVEEAGFHLKELA